VLVRLVQGDGDQHHAERSHQHPTARQVEQERRRLLRVLVARLAGRATTVPRVDRHLGGGDDEDAVDDPLAEVLDAVLALVTFDGVADGGLDEPPQRQRHQPGDQHHQQELAEGLLGELGEGAGLADLVPQQT
jgi:hypothetical protein